MLDGLIKQLIIKLRNRSFLLFLLPTLALIGSLLIHNYIVNFNYKPSYYNSYNHENIKFTCDIDNKFCQQFNFFVPVQNKIIGNCGKFNNKVSIEYKGQIGLSVYDFLLEFDNFHKLDELTNSLFDNNSSEKFYLEFITDEQNNDQCIKNSTLFFLYKLFPSPFQKIYDIKNVKNYQAATSEPVFPILYGETSISNIVKRFPINFFFKPLIYISCIFMLLYWHSYNQIINQIYNKKKINKFLIFGFLSSLFLFFHVILLGIEIDNKIFKLTKRLIVIFFILFEVIAQYCLIKVLYSLKEKIRKYINLIYLNLKILLISTVIIATILLLIILLLADLDSKVDYILEWNYFLILLFYYLLSFLMWKKND